MNWSMTLKRAGVVEQVKSGEVSDPFWSIAVQSPGAPVATIEAKVSHWGEHVSVNFSVSLQCPQSKSYIEEAAKLAFITATRFVNEAVSKFDSGMPMLPTG